MAIEKELRELVKRKGLRQTARELGINSGSLYRSIMNGSNVGLDRIEAILNLFGYELRISKRKEVIKVDKERRPIHCKHFTKPQCPNKKALKESENLAGEMYGGVMIDKRPVIEKASRICGECKSFKPKKGGNL